jgi:hypothetical protein
MDRSQMTTHSSLVPVAASLGISVALLLAFVWAFVAAYHQPQPHDLPLGVVAAPTQSAQIRAALATRAPGVFHVEGYSSVADVMAAVSRDSLSGALVVRSGRALAVVASAGGEPAKVVIVSALSALARQAHLPLTVRDVRPLPPHDPQGISAFFVVFGLVLASFLFAAVLYALGRSLSFSVRLGALTVYVILAGLATGLVVDPMLGALTGHFWQVALLAALLALAVSAVTGALAQLLGPPGIGLAALLLIILGNSSSGGPVPYRFLPDGFRQISQFFPSGAGVTGVRHAVYFAGESMTQPTVVLICWSLAGLIGLMVAAILRRGAVTEVRRENIERVTVG